MPNLSVAVDHHDITVSKPSLGLSITHRRQGRILEAVESLRIDPSAEELLPCSSLEGGVCKGAVPWLA